MSKTIVKIQLDERIIISEPLFLTDTLLSIRETIKKRINVLFLFLNKEGNIINKNEENSVCANNIINKEIIKLKSENREIEIYLNNEYICSINLNYLEERQNLEEFRKKLILLNENLNENTLFLDKYIDVIERKNENNIVIKDIINKNKIKLIINNADFSKYTIIDKIINEDEECQECQDI